MKGSEQGVVVLFGLLFVVFFCFIEIRWLYNNCGSLGGDCLYLTLFGIIVVITTIVIIELSTKYRKKRWKWYQMEKVSIDKKNNNYVWTKSVVRIMLTSLLLSFSLFLQGAFGMLLSGVFVGLGLEMIVKGLTGDLAPRIKSEKKD